ncbi:hypothetical protein FACS1894121_1680 [Bacteroidia bacterium]|nr:hypothetical protein FACS1894121_1680 [Bacteroidia bacterium]
MLSFDYLYHLQIQGGAYIVLALEGGPNEYLSHCLQRIKTKIDDNYFEPFESILHSANAYAEDRTLPADFAYLKKRADKIDDLNERELYYQEHATRYKQAQNIGDIITQIDSEVELIKTQKGLIAPTESVETKCNEDSDIPDKLKTVVYIELFRLMEKGKNINDISAMARFISFMTGQSYKKLYKQMLEEIRLTSYHAEAVKKMNDYFQALNISISIEINKQY